MEKFNVSYLSKIWRKKPMEKMNNKKSKLRDLVRHSSSYTTRQFGRTGKTDEHIKVATKLQKVVI